MVKVIRNEPSKTIHPRRGRFYNQFEEQSHSKTRRTSQEVKTKGDLK